MPKLSWRTGAIYCLLIWAGIWFVWLLMRFSLLDIRVIPGIGLVLLASLVSALLAPGLAAVVAVIALFRQPRELLNWLALGFSIAVLSVQGFVFMAMGWM